jgi:hypothetical protein
LEVCTGVKIIQIEREIAEDIVRYEMDSKVNPKLRTSQALHGQGRATIIGQREISRSIEIIVLICYYLVGLCSELYQPAGNCLQEQSISHKNKSVFVFRSIHVTQGMLGST